MRPTTVYLAARYSRREELCGYRTDLIQHGIQVPARWLNGSHQLDNDGRPIGDSGELMFESGSAAADHFREKFAQDDFDDVVTADVLVAFTEVPRSQDAGAGRGGRHVELGIALGLGIPALIVGPRENVFCWLPQVVQFNTWDACLVALTNARWPSRFSPEKIGTYR